MNTLEDYFKEVDRLRFLGKELHLTDEDIDRIIDDSFQFLEEQSPLLRESRSKGSTKWTKSLFKVIGTVIIVILLSYVAYTYRKVAHNYVERNIQEIIYPGMKLLRKLMLPVIQMFPSLTEWYDEACLIGNPYFQVSDLDCWPCEGVKSILNLTSTSLNSDQYHSGIPFIYRRDCQFDVMPVVNEVFDFGQDEAIKSVSLENLVERYQRDREMWERDMRPLEDLEGKRHPSKILLFSPSSFTHFTWKVKRLEGARALRQLFGEVRKVPSHVSGATPEKILLIDAEDTPSYPLPATEGSNVFVVQGTGSRLLLLMPSPECASACSRVSILLPPHHALWFNWWYWRGVSLPTKEGGVSITYLASYY